MRQDRRTTVDQANLVANALIAAATIGTLVWAIRTTLSESRLSRDERQSRRLAEERAQASGVVAWERQWFDRDASEPTEHRQLNVLNASSSAVFDVTVHFPVRLEGLVGDAPDSGFQWWHAVIPPSHAPEPLTPDPLEFCTKFGENETLRVTFRDGAGLYWERDTTGGLIRRRDLEGLTEDQRREARYEQHLREMDALGLR